MKTIFLYDQITYPYLDEFYTPIRYWISTALILELRPALQEALSIIDNSLNRSIRFSTRDAVEIYE